MKEELEQGLEFPVTSGAFDDGNGVNAKSAAATPGRPGRGRPTLAEARGISEVEAKRLQALGNSLRVQRSKKKAKAKARYPEGGILLDLELAAIDREYDQKEVVVGLKKRARNASAEPKAPGRAGRYPGEGKGCRYVYHALPTGTFDLDVYVADKDKPKAFSSFPYRLADLTKEQLDGELEILRIQGFTPTGFRRPLEQHVAEALNIKARQKDGEFDLVDDDEAKSQAALKAAKAVKKQATIGLVLGLLAHRRGHQDLILREGRKSDIGGTYFRLYDIIGDIEVPATSGAFEASLEDWVKQIASAGLKSAPPTGVGKVGVDACSKVVIRERLKMLRAAFRAAAGVASCFPTASQAETILSKQRIARAVDDVERAGRTRGRISYRSLYRREVEIIFKTAPTLTHVAFVVLNLSTGLRPELLKLLSSQYFDAATGSLRFYDALRYETHPGGEKKRISEDLESVVVRLILSFPEVFNVGLMETVAYYYEHTFKRHPDLIAFKKKAKLRTVARHRDFRTSCAQNLRQSGMGIEDIALRLGNTEAVALKHYANTPPPDAKGVKRGRDFYKDDLDLKVDGVNVCEKGPAWDGWLLKKFVVECIRRKREELGDGKALEAFRRRLGDKALAAFHYQPAESVEALQTWSDTYAITSLDEL